MKGIILAGGSGSRLYPSSVCVSKQLLPIHSSPLLYHSLTYLMRSDIKEFVVITNSENVELFRTLLKDGSQWGIHIDIVGQDSPNGIAEAYILAEPYIKGENNILMLGDNIFYGYNKLLHMNYLISGIVNTNLPAGIINYP